MENKRVYTELTLQKWRTFLQMFDEQILGLWVYLSKYVWEYWFVTTDYIHSIMEITQAGILAKNLKPKLIWE